MIQISNYVKLVYQMPLNKVVKIKIGSCKMHKLATKDCARIQLRSGICENFAHGRGYLRPGHGDGGGDAAAGIFTLRGAAASTSILHGARAAAQPSEERAPWPGWEEAGRRHGGDQTRLRDPDTRDRKKKCFLLATPPRLTGGHWPGVTRCHKM